VDAPQLTLTDRYVDVFHHPLPATASRSRSGDWDRIARRPRFVGGRLFAACCLRVAQRTLPGS
jgi:hypothetical protein